MSARTVLRADAAIEDTEAIAAEDPSAALAALARIERRVTGLANPSARGRIGPALRDIGAPRCRGFVERPWRIVHRIEAERASVLAAPHAPRDLQAPSLERVTR